MHNDPYTLYYRFNRPSQLTKRQIEFLKTNSTGSPEYSELIKIDSKGYFEREFPLHENDVYLVNFRRL